MNFSSDSVNDFLRKVRGAKAKQRQTVSQELEPLLSDPSTYAVGPVLGKQMDEALEAYGDEALKQMAMVAIGKWLDVHNGLLDEHLERQDISGALFTMSDASKITTALRILGDIGSFGGDDDYRAAMREQINQAVLEGLEESGQSPEEFFYGKNDKPT